MIIVDRFEGDFAVCEKGYATLRIDRALLRGRVEEGDVLCAEGPGYRTDAEATCARRAQIEARRQLLLNRHSR